MRRLGVDPGASGAIVLLENGQPVEWAMMPIMKTGATTRVNAVALAALIRSFIKQDEPMIAFVEQVHAMPKQGVTSMFSFGHSCGVVAGVLGTLEISTTFVTPQTWKKREGLLGSDKDAARFKAIMLWPYWRALDKKISGQALADAAFIARSEL